MQKMGAMAGGSAEPTSAGMRDAGNRTSGEPSGLLPPPRSDSERFFEDLKAFVADTEQLLRQAHTLSGDGALAARAEFERRLAHARGNFELARAKALNRMLDWRERTEASVRRDPWKAIGIAAGAGFLLGMLSGHGDDR